MLMIMNRVVFRRVKRPSVPPVDESLLFKFDMVSIRMYMSDLSIMSLMHFLCA
jgi:hypothetical protein